MDSAWQEALSPLSYLERSAAVFGDRTAVIDGERRFTYAEFHDRARRLAAGLGSIGARPGARVAVLAPNVAVTLEAHYGVPLAGMVLLALNTRLTAQELAYIVGHSGAAVLLYDHQWRDVATEIGTRLTDLRLIEAGGSNDEYEELLDRPPAPGEPVADENALISLNYTSGTTGSPKGVMYTHRGAYLQALSVAFHSRLDSSSVFLWTLPMFHCNGWCYTWAVTAAGATHLCLREFDPVAVWELIRSERVTHFNGAPTVLTMLAYSESAGLGGSDRTIRVATGGAPPSPTILERMSELGIDVTHLYGLTETYGPIGICDWRAEWDALPAVEQAQLKARQGVGTIVSERIRVVDDDGADVPVDGATLGQIAVRGNNVMAGYYEDPEATAAAAPDGWLRTGDIGVMHPDGYIELRDRAKDIIISGGENISSVEVEQAVVSHSAVLEAAVIGEPDDTWGEVPVAYVTLKDGAAATAEEIIEHVKVRIARYKAPKRVVFGPLPKTSTGKVQKFVLREAAWTGRARRIH